MRPSPIPGSTAGRIAFSSRGAWSLRQALETPVVIQVADASAARTARSRLMRRCSNTRSEDCGRPPAVQPKAPPRPVQIGAECRPARPGATIAGCGVHDRRLFGGRMGPAPAVEWRSSMGPVEETGVRPRRRCGSGPLTCSAKVFRLTRGQPAALQAPCGSDASVQTTSSDA